MLMAMEQLWTAVDAYFDGRLIPSIPPHDAEPGCEVICAHGSRPKGSAGRTVLAIGAPVTAR